MGYFKDTFNGISWMGGFRIAYRVIGIIRIGIIAHILSPLAMGVFGIGTMALAFLEIITETGINIFLVQEKDKIDDYVDTAWVISILRGAVISLLVFITAGPVSQFFNSPESKNLLYMVSLVPLLRGFINPSIIKFQKNLEFNKEFLYRISIFLVETIFSVAGAFILRSPIGLLWGLLGAAVFEIFYTFLVVGPRPRFILEKRKLTKIVGRGKWVTLFGIFDYLYTQSDNIIVGKMLGVAPLGVYQNAYKISTAPLTEVGDVFFRVTFPVFAKISGDIKRLKSAFIKNTIVNGILMTLGGVFIFIFAKPIVNILLGSGWESAVPVMKLLSILGVVRGIAGSTNSLLVAKEKQKYSAIVMIISTLGLLVSIVPLIKTYGIIGAGMAAILGTLISLPFTLYFVGKTLKNN